MTKYLITVSTPSRHGRTKLHNFGKLIEAEHLPWSVETHASPKQMKQRITPESPLGRNFMIACMEMRSASD